ncbi:MAG: glycosyltransferase family 2 protein [Pikeienuella sp.]
MNAPTGRKIWARADPQGLFGAPGGPDPWAGDAGNGTADAPTGVSSAPPRPPRRSPSDARLAARRAARAGLGTVDLAAAPPDPALLQAADAPLYLRHGLLPWRRRGRVTTYAVVDPAELPSGLAKLSVRPELACAVVCTRAGLATAVATALGPALAARAAHRTPPEMSLRTLVGLRLRVALVLLALFCAGLLAGEAFLAIALAALVALNAATAALRLAALVAGDGCRDRESRAGPPLPNSGLPMTSVLVPLYREGRMVRQIVDAVSRLDYPKGRLEVLLLLEADDVETRAAVAQVDLPFWIRPVTVPPGLPRTKPRALNYALDFARGEIIGILDAEDRPDPGQLRAVATTLAAAPRRVACVQCQLAYHNARENWLSRCFQIEYSIWFDVLLRGFQALRLPIPLGGTSVYFRRGALETVGAWDAQNVTEDADLGMRLARRGWRVAVLGSVTEEEANCIAWRWVRQRSRWLKGYLLTWLTHMRRPGRLWRDLGTRGFLGLNLLLLGGAASYLAIPLFWAALVGWVITGEAVWHSALPGWIAWLVGATLAAGQTVMLVCAAIALGRRRQLGLIWVVPTLPLYWTLGALAAWKAVIELLVAPFWWDKTEHGLSRALTLRS